MPSLPKHACAYPGCRELVEAREGGYCPAHRKQRAKTTERLYDRRWQKASLAFRKENPLCADPYKIHGVEPAMAALVDHIKPHRGDPGLMWDQSNWQALCRNCHNRKTREEGPGWEPPHGGGGEGASGPRAL
jgi:5-methylcytosine-specific restriction protein A